MAGWRFRIFEFIDERGRSVIGDWLDAERITSRDRNLLKAKMDLLALQGTELTGLVAGPISSKRNRRMQSHIYKLVIHGDRMLRPMLCKGPIDMEQEFTLLLGAIETGDILDHDAEDAEQNRAIVMRDPARRILNGRYK